MLRLFQPTRIRLLFVALLSECLANAVNLPSQNTNYLDSVDYNLGRASYFSNKAIADIQLKRDSLAALPMSKQYEQLALIGKQLEQIDIYSAVELYRDAERMAMEEGNKRYANKFRYRKSSVMPMMGLVREGIEMYMNVPLDDIDPLDKFDYFTTGHHIFDAAVDYYPLDTLKARYQHLSSIFADSALVYVEPGSIEEIYYNALPKLTGVNRQMGIDELNIVLETVPPEDPLFAKAAAEIASAYLDNAQTDEARYYLALSAIGDLKAGTRESTSLHRLGKILFNEQDYSRAYDYLAYALEAAVASGSRLRTIEIGEIMPFVVNTGRQLEHQRNQTLVLIVITLSMAVIVFACILVYAFRTRNQLRRTQKHLVNANDSKDNYIRKLLSLCGAYLDALENFNVLAGRKIKVGQINDLLSMIESGKVIREQLQNFYEVFDDAFLAVYPDFVDQVNELLLPDKKISLTDDGRMSTELRIVAFMKLGLDDSTQIAKFLGLSLNTIYTYRNKVKTRAKDRDYFEQNIRNIGR